MQSNKDNYMENLQKVKRLMMGFAAFKTMATACEMNLFQLLLNRPGLSRKEIAKELKLEEHPARVLLLSCCTYELLKRRNERYHNTLLAEQFLTENASFPILAFTKYCDIVQYRSFAHLGESIRENRNAGLQTIPGSGDSLYKRLAESPELEALFQAGMAPKDRSSRQFLFETPEFAEVNRLLDVGGGPGYISGHLKQAFPNLNITLFDLPTVCTRAKAHWESENLKDLDTNPGDFFEDPFPTGRDAVLFSHVLEIFSQDKILGLLKKAHEALPNGGKVFIYGMGCDDNESGGDMAAWGSLYFLGLASGEGMMYPASEYRQLLNQAGFSTVIDRKNDFENILVIATK